MTTMSFVAVRYFIYGKNRTTFVRELLSTLQSSVGGILARHRKCDAPRGRPPLIHSPECSVTRWILFYLYICLQEFDAHGCKTQSRGDCTGGGKRPAPDSSTVSPLVCCYMNEGLHWLQLHVTIIILITTNKCDLSLNAILPCNYRGAGQEVGRSCIILEFKGRKIMVNYDFFFFLCN